MANTISDGITTITPTLVLGYKTDTTSRNVVHTIIGRAAPDVSLAPDSLRTGDLELFFAEEADAWAAQRLHTRASVFTLIDTDLPLTGMTYVRSGRMNITLDPQTRLRWLLTIGYQEVAG